MRQLEVMRPAVNVDTLKDGRGAVVTWVPPEPIVEWNLIDTKPGSDARQFGRDADALLGWPEHDADAAYAQATHGRRDITFHGQLDRNQCLIRDAQLGSPPIVSVDEAR